MVVEEDYRHLIWWSQEAGLIGAQEFKVPEAKAGFSLPLELPSREK
jgi:hypothetical protein